VLIMTRICSKNVQYLCQIDEVGVKVDSSGCFTKVEQQTSQIVND